MPDPGPLIAATPQAMNHTTTRSVAALLVREKDEIVRRWLSRVSDRVTVDERFIFPSEDLLDHVPRLIEGIAAAIEGDTPLTVNTPVVLKAREMGRLRFDQGFSARQILWEYQLLGSVVFHRLEESDVDLEGAGAGLVIRRLFDALTAVQRSTMEEFLDHYERTIHEREERLRGFNFALTHELRTEIGAILGAARMLGERFVVQEPEQRDQFVRIVVDNAERVEHLVGNLLELSRVQNDSRRHRNVLLKHAAEEAARQLRAFAEARGVEIRLAPDLPGIEVNAAAVELALTNLIANGIKYHAPDRDERWVEVRAERTDEEGEGGVTVTVADNGRGIIDEERPRLFERFFRASSSDGVEGTGLGLHLVKTAIVGVGGDVWAEFPESGETVFVFTLPARRREDDSG